MDSPHHSSTADPAPDLGPDFSLAPYFEALRVSASLAIVGNSADLIGAGRGAEIDAHHQVIRFNSGVVSGYEADIGSRTSLRFVGGSFKSKDAARRLGRVVAQDQADILTKPNNQVMAEFAFPGKTVHYMKRWGALATSGYALLEPYTGLHYSYDGRQPRSGILLLALLMQCSEGKLKPSVYGFDVEDRTGPGWCLHYFEKKPRENFFENFATAHAPIEWEWNTLKTLAERGHIRLVTQR